MSTQQCPIKLYGIKTAINVTSGSDVITLPSTKNLRKGHILKSECFENTDQFGETSYNAKVVQILGPNTIRIDRPASCDGSSEMTVSEKVLVDNGPDRFDATKRQYKTIFRRINNTPPKYLGSWKPTDSNIAEILQSIPTYVDNNYQRNQLKFSVKVFCGNTFLGASPVYRAPLPISGSFGVNSVTNQLVINRPARHPAQFFQSGRKRSSYIRTGTKIQRDSAMVEYENTVYVKQVIEDAFSSAMSSASNNMFIRGGRTGIPKSIDIPTCWNSLDGPRFEISASVNGINIISNKPGTIGNRNWMSPTGGLSLIGKKL